MTKQEARKAIGLRPRYDRQDTVCEVKAMQEAVIPGGRVNTRMIFAVLSLTVQFPPCRYDFRDYCSHNIPDSFIHK